MTNLLCIMRSSPDYNGSDGRSESQIIAAEKALNLRFAPDYRLYLEKIGLACLGSREFTGLTTESRLDVVSVTREEHLQFPEIPSEFYVVEQANIDGIVIWQNTSGEIFQTMPGHAMWKLCNSLAEYIQKY